MGREKYKLIVIGASAGGFRALQSIVCALPRHFPLPIVVAQHLSSGSQGLMAELISTKCHFATKEADDKESVYPGNVYLAPPDYHLLIEVDGRIALSSDEKENYSRPSIDVLFESAADVYRSALIAVLLTGASSDGAKGVRAVKDAGGVVIVQDPASAEYRTMPEAGIAAGPVDHVVPLPEIAPLLVERSGGDGKGGR